ncbi:MAG TPA: sulfate ABC transporter permease subunit CysT [Anaerolineae bacterium]|nr:sulfate ABC transporter permease subunit CysT [Anaerolineae bacterium]HNU03376.1 sulfate ABC transporter permease subunit CysT [Anaerolineae bacterium]
MSQRQAQRADKSQRRQGVPWGRWGLRVSALSYLALILIIPLLVVFQDGLSEGLRGLWSEITRPVAWAALMLTLRTSAVMVIINTVMGTLTAYVLVRYEFPGKSLLNALVDLPLAIPTLVTGVMLVILYGPQEPLGAWLERALGLRVIFASPGIVLALLFVTFPFVVRAVQPVLLSLDRSVEDAAASLGAGPWTIFRRVTLPPLLLPLTSGALLSFARAVGEFGAIIVVAGNIPLRSQTAAVYVWGEVESENRFGASAVSVALMVIAFSLILAVDLIQSRRQGEDRT